MQRRHAEYTARAGASAFPTPWPKIHRQGDTRWIYPIMDAIIDGIRAQDPASIEIGVEFIEADGKFPFGAGLKAKTARALRHVDLPHALQERIRRRVVSMLIAGNTPREYREYARLLRKIGFSSWWPRIDADTSRDHRYAMRWYGYFRAIHARARRGSPRRRRPPRMKKAGFRRLFGHRATRKHHSAKFRP